MHFTAEEAKAAKRVAGEAQNHPEVKLVAIVNYWFDRKADRETTIVAYLHEQSGCVRDVRLALGAAAGREIYCVTEVSPQQMIDKCRDIYAAVRDSGNVGCLGADYQVYYVNLRTTPITAAQTPTVHDGTRVLPPKVSLKQTFTDEVTGASYLTLEELLTTRLRSDVTELLMDYFQKESPATGLAIKADSPLLVAEMLIGLTPKVVELIEKHKVR